MVRRAVIAAGAAAAMLASPVAAAPRPNPASSLSLRGVRAPTATRGHDRLAGNGTTTVAVVAILVAIAAVVLISDGGADSN